MLCMYIYLNTSVKATNILASHQEHWRFLLKIKSGLVTSCSGVPLILNCCFTHPYYLLSLVLMTCPTVKKKHPSICHVLNYKCFVFPKGFITMTPQLFINYKMKSVAHLPWRMLTYKALNTFIDDLFAFVIKMPMMYRIGCLRDGTCLNYEFLNMIASV